LAYSIRGLIAERRYLDRIADVDPRLGLVDLEHGDFALVPLTDAAVAVCSGRWGATLVGYDDVDVTIQRYEEAAIRFMAAIHADFQDMIVAFVEAQIWVDMGGGFGLVVGKGPYLTFNRQSEAWPDTNISLALKAIGIPEGLDQGMDAFDVAGLGRKRSTDDWLRPDRPWETRRPSKNPA
jgi:hypothetical protein